MSHCACTGRKAFLPAGITRLRRGREGRTNASSTAVGRRRKKRRERERKRKRGRAAAESDPKQQRAIGKGNHWYQPCIASAVRNFPLPLSRSHESTSPMTAGGEVQFLLFLLFLIAVIVSGARYRITELRPSCRRGKGMPFTSFCCYRNGNFFICKKTANRTDRYNIAVQEYRIGLWRESS